MLINILITIVIIFFIILLWITYTRAFGAEWVKMPKAVRKEMLKLLRLNKQDIFYDLGCGDGQLLIEASPKVKQAIGVEIDPIRFLIARARTTKTKNKQNIKIIYGNLFKKQFNKATKMAIFLCPETDIKLGKKLKQELSQKTKIASYKWPIADLKLVKHDKKHRIYLHGN